jgi:hypothetical protein
MSLYEDLHLKDPLPDHEPERFRRAAELYERVIRRGKTRGFTGIFSRKDLARAKRNAERLAWAREMREEIVRDAGFWVEKGDEELYAMIPTQNPLALTPAQYHGCPIHGGNRSNLETDLLHPYQWRCTLGGEWWSNGVEVVNPGTGQRVRMADEGPGWVAPEGFPNAGTTYYFVGAYRCVLLYRLFSRPYSPQTGEGHQGRPAALALALAYALTGERRYAHKVGILLNRLAEVYGRFRGIKEGWEAYDRSKDPIRGYVGEASGREQGFIERVTLAYDLVFDALREDGETIRFFEARGGADYDGDGRATPGDVLFNIDRNLFAYIYEFLDRTLPLAGGDFLTSSLYALVQVGACLENGPMIRQALEDRTALYNVMTNSFFRDGKWWYDSTGYCAGHARMASEAAEWAHGFTDLEIFTRPIDLYEDPRFRLREIMTFSRLMDCDGRLPQIGDTGGGRNRVLRGTYSVVDEIGYLRLADQREAYARRIVEGTGGDVEAGRKGGDLYLLFHAEPWEERETERRRRGETEKEHLPASPLPRFSGSSESVLFHDSNFCILRAGGSRETRRHVALNYGKWNRGHGHRDKLAVNVIAYGYDLSADVGYPASWVSPKIGGWETHTASHCTVAVDGENQAFSTGSLNLFIPGPWVRLADASGERAYPDRVRLYRRAVALVPIDEDRAYVVDVFRVKGGKTHDYSFHSLGGDEGERFELDLPEGTVLQAQSGGTLAGPEVGFAEQPGYGFIKDVACAGVDGRVRATWRAEEDGVGLRLHVLGQSGTTVLTGRGEGNGNLGQSPWDRYLIVRRGAEGGGEASSCFAAVLEPFSMQPYLDRVEALEGPGGSDAPAGLKITAGDVTHYVLQTPDGAGFKGEIDGLPVEFAGEWAFIERDGAGVRRMQLVNGTLLKAGGRVLHGSGELRGSIEAVDVQGQAVVVSASSPVPTDGSLNSHTLIVSNPDYLCNATYTIAGVEASGEGRCRLRLDGGGFLLSEGQVTGVDAGQGVLLTDTPMLKLEMASNLFDGKVVSHERGHPGPRLRTAEKGRLVLAGPAQAASFEGKRFYVYDVGVGDTWRIPVISYLER